MTCCLCAHSATSLINLPKKGGDLQAKDEALDNYIRLVINNFFAALDTGIPALGLPILDPLNLGDITIPTLT
jgi:Haemolymph juvenile hormone binding protein (JHBP)